MAIQPTVRILTVRRGYWSRIDEPANPGSEACDNVNLYLSHELFLSETWNNARSYAEQEALPVTRILFKIGERD